ncbi:MAG: response regulator [Lachnospiraceae bacterium]|nr:response regulator [Lachnospiraceae bacterium]
MEFFNQSRQNQRKQEKLVIILYSIYTLNLCISAVQRGWDVWIPGIMLVELTAGWSIFLAKYRNYRVRAVIGTVMIQLTLILYACNVDDISVVVPSFMAMTVLVAFYGFSELLGITLVSLFFILFYHGVIHNTLRMLPKEELRGLFAQVGNIFCVLYILYIWLRNRVERNEEVHKIIEALMDAEQSKDDFLSNVSHEIRTPVNTICGMSEMALREHDVEKMREEVFDIRDAGHDLMSLVSDILDFSQLQQGKMNLEEEAYNITSTINDIINMAMARKADKQIELIVDCDAGIPSGLYGDEQKIRRVIMNLVDNAVKFTNEGGVIIKIYTRKENYGVNLCVSVRDTGIGIEEEGLEKLFESFSQIDTRRSRQEGGIGLGLAISRALVQKMGGTITVRSRIGKGSLFRFVVPQKVLDEKPIGQVENREMMNIAAYFDMEQFDMMAIRDEYTGIITSMIRQLHVRCHVCRNLAELKRREEHSAFTHVFISLEEYQEDEVYFDALAKRARVIMVIDRPREKYITNPDIIRLYKPFYILPVVSILNGSRGSVGGKQMVRPGKFIAPGAHVLVVDDNRMNIRVVEGLLKEYQIGVTYATSGQEALQLIENMTYDFVFMDHMMPEMDGIEAMHHIREKVGHYYRKLPIIALTANAAPGNREMFLEEGFDDFISKPIEVSVLERVLKRNLPAEKLIFLTKTDAEETAEPQRGKEKFVIGSLDVEKGMLYCGGKEEYLNILEAYYEERHESWQLLEELFEKHDWKNYTIKVHALKSMMQNIGALSLSARAKALELAGKRDDLDYILKNHADMLEEYRRVMKELEDCPLVRTMETAGAATNAGAASGTKNAGADGAINAAGIGEQTADGGNGEAVCELPELTEEDFDKILTELEDAMYVLDGARLSELVSRLQGYCYCGTSLTEALEPLHKKIKMSDYMSAVDAVSRIRERLKQKGGGKA